MRCTLSRKPGADPLCKDPEECRYCGFEAEEKKRRKEQIRRDGLTYVHRRGYCLIIERPDDYYQYVYGLNDEDYRKQEDK